MRLLLPKTYHEGTHRSGIGAALLGPWSGDWSLGIRHPGVIEANLSQGHLTLTLNPWRRPAMGEPIRRCSG